MGNPFISGTLGFIVRRRRGRFAQGHSQHVLSFNRCPKPYRATLR